MNDACILSYCIMVKNIHINLHCIYLSYVILYDMRLTHCVFLKDKYRLNFGEYKGNAGNSLAGGFHPEVQWWASHQGMNFSTFDNDNDRYERNCAKEDKSGWWFNR